MTLHRRGTHPLDNNELLGNPTSETFIFSNRMNLTSYYSNEIFDGVKVVEISDYALSIGVFIVVVSNGHEDTTFIPKDILLRDGVIVLGVVTISTNAITVHNVTTDVNLINVPIAMCGPDSMSVVGQYCSIDYSPNDELVAPAMMLTDDNYNCNLLLPLIYFYEVDECRLDEALISHIHRFPKTSDSGLEDHLSTVRDKLKTIKVGKDAKSPDVLADISKSITLIEQSMRLL